MKLLVQLLLFAISQRCDAFCLKIEDEDFHSTILSIAALVFAEQELGLSFMVPFRREVSEPCFALAAARGFV